VVTKYDANRSKAFFIDILIEGSTPTTATTESNLTSWITALKVPFSTARDVDPSAYTSKTLYGIRETTYIVERDTRKIVAKTTSIENGLTKLDALPP